MSHSTYRQLWHRAQSSVGEVLQLEAAGPGPDTDPENLHPQNTLFLKYVRIFHQLQLLQDQMVQPQKWQLVQQLLQALMGRLLEVQRDMVETGLSEFHFMDDTMQDLKLTPSSVEIPIPRYFTREAEKLREDRKAFLGRLLEPEGPAVEAEVLLTTEEAVRIVQAAERARQGRLRADLMRNIQREEQREKRRKLLPPVTMETPHAATLIQKVWRGHRQRKQTVQQRDEEFQFIGMVHSAVPETPAAATADTGQRMHALQADTGQRMHALQADTGQRMHALQAEAEERMHALQAERWAEFVRDQPRIRQLVLETEGPELREALRGQIRNWFIECYNSSGRFPDFPSAEQGGSAVVFTQKTPEQLLAELAAAAEEREHQATNKGSKKEAVPERKQRKKGAEPRLEGLSEFLPDIIEEQKTYTTMWKERDDSSNQRQQHEVELEKEVKRREVEEEVRLQVDELMREELRNLRMAIERDSSEPTRTKPKSKKKGKDKGAKKKDKDLTAHRTLSSLCDELIDQGLLKAAPRVRLSSYLGDVSYRGSSLLRAGVEALPSPYNIRQIITTYAILPLGSVSLHEKAPLVRSILLAGPLGVGKRTLVHSVCTETSATLFDLSARNIAGKYPGRAGLQLMLHMVLKVAKLLQPSVLWVDEAEKTFLRRVSREDRALEPRRLRKELPKLLRHIRGGDRVLLIGTTRRPFDADPRPLCKVYERIVLVPRADYSSRLLIWRQLIEDHGGTVSSSLDLSSLAKISDGYTPGHMAQAVKSVLTDHRLRQTVHSPLTASSFIRALSKIQPVYEQEEEAFKSWVARTPLMRRALKLRREKEALEKAAQEAAEKERKRRR